MRVIKLSQAEINHLLSLIEVCEREGWYYGNLIHFKNRMNKLKEKIISLKTPK